MDANVNNSSDSVRAKSSRRKYVTLAFLLVWVAVVFIFTFFKFSGGGR